MGRNKSYERKEVLQKALDLFWKKGFEGTHLQELVDVTKLNRFSLYKEFGGKDGLFEQAVEQYLFDLKDTGACLRSQPLGLNNILEYLRLIVHADFSYGCFMVNTMTQKNIIQERINKMVDNFVAQSENAILKNLLAAQNKREIDKGMNVKALAKLLVVFDIGLVTFDLLGPTLEDKKGIFQVLKVLLEKSPSPESRQTLSRAAQA